MVGRPANARPAVPVAASGANQGWLAGGTTAPARRAAVPSVGTLIFIAFLGLTAFRLIGEFARGLDTETPAVTTPAPAGQPTVRGSIVFGVESDGDCGVLGIGDVFAEGADVWWSAWLSTEQKPDAEVVIIVRLNGDEVDREDVPPDASFGVWSVLCSGEPVVESRAGLYQVEVWDATMTVQHAIGEYRLTAP